MSNVEKFMFKGMLLGMLADIRKNNPNSEASFLEACREIGQLNVVIFEDNNEPRKHTKEEEVIEMMKNTYKEMYPETKEE